MKEPKQFDLPTFHRGEVVLFRLAQRAVWMLYIHSQHNCNRNREEKGAGDRQEEQIGRNKLL